MPYVNERWLGGLLTNFNTMQQADRAPARAQRLSRTRASSTCCRPRSACRWRPSCESSRPTSAASRTWSACPTRVFVTDLKVEEIGVREAARLDIPTIGLVDTNCDPEQVDYVIPGNDDAIRSNDVMIKTIGDAAADGRGALAAARSRPGARPRRPSARRGRGARKRKEAEERGASEAEEQAKRGGRGAGGRRGAGRSRRARRPRPQQPAARRRTARPPQRAEHGRETAQ